MGRIFRSIKMTKPPSSPALYKVFFAFSMVNYVLVGGVAAVTVWEIKNIISRKIFKDEAKINKDEVKINKDEVNINNDEVKIYKDYSQLKINKDDVKINKDEAS